MPFYIIYYIELNELNQYKDHFRKYNAVIIAEICLKWFEISPRLLVVPSAAVDGKIYNT